MRTELCDLPAFTLDPAHPERVPGDVAALVIPDLAALDLARLPPLRALRVLRVHGGITDGEALARLAAALPSTERVELHGARGLGLALLDAVARLPALTELVTDAPAAPLLQALAPLRPWRALGFSHGGVSADELALLASLPALRALRLTNGDLRDAAALAPLGALERLESLEVFAFSVEPPRMSELPWLPRLRALRRLHLGAALDATVTSLPALERLVACNPLPSALARLAQLPRLTHLDLVGLTVWTGAHTVALATLPALGALVAWRLPLDDRGLAALLAARPWRSLTLEGLTGPGLAFADAPHTLEALDLKHCDVTDDGLRAIARLPSLRSLGVSFCERVTAAGLASLGALAGLASFRAWSLPALDDAALAPIAALPSLRALDLFHVHNLTPRAVAPLAARPGFFYAGPGCLAEAEALAPDARAVTEPFIEGLCGDAAGALAALRGRASVRLEALTPTPSKPRSLRAAAWHLRFDARGDLAVTAGAALVAWDVASAKKRATLKVPRGLVQALDLSADGSVAVTVVQRGHDALVLGWRPESSGAAFSFATARAEAASVALSPDLADVVASTVHVTCTEAATGRERWRVTGLTGPVAFTRDGAAVVVASPEGVVFLDAATGRALRRLTVDAFARAWWVLYERGALVRDRALRRPGRLWWQSIEASDDGAVVLTARVEASAAWVVARARGDELRAARVCEPEASGLRANLGLSRGGAHALVHVCSRKGEAPSVGVVSRHRVEALLGEGPLPVGVASPRSQDAHGAAR